MNCPHIYDAEDLNKQCQSVLASKDGVTWHPTRPVGFWGLCLKHRVKAAWMVFTGKADVVTWRF